MKLNFKKTKGGSYRITLTREELKKLVSNSSLYFLDREVTLKKRINNVLSNKERLKRLIANSLYFNLIKVKCFLRNMGNPVVRKKRNGSVEVFIPLIAPREDYGKEQIRISNAERFIIETQKNLAITASVIPCVLAGIAKGLKLFNMPKTQR